MSKDQHVIEPSDAITFLKIKFLIAAQKETDNVRKADYFSSCFKQLFFTFVLTIQITSLDDF